MTTSQLEYLCMGPDWVVVDKPSGLSVHRGWDASRDNAISRLRRALSQHVHPVHRLDRGTSGALLMALTPQAASVLSESFREGRVTKEYVALVRGRLDASGRIEHPLAGTTGERLEALTLYQPLAVARDRYTLTLVQTLSGRRHQIRRHMKHISRPVLGDTTYGDGRENRKMREEIGLNRLALHARRLGFQSPAGEHVEALSPLPADLREPLARLGFSPDLLDELSR